MSKLKVFGSKAWVHILPKQDKFSERAEEMRFVGYSTNGYRLWDPETNEIKISRDVRFNETHIKYTEDHKKEEDSILNDGSYVDKFEQQDNTNQEIYEEDTQKSNEEENKQEITTRSGRIIHRPRRMSEEYELYSAYCLLSGDPQEYEQAVEDIHWKNEIRKELNSQIKLKK